MNADRNEQLPGKVGVVVEVAVVVDIVVLAVVAVVVDTIEDLLQAPSLIDRMF